MTDGALCMRETNLGEKAEIEKEKSAQELFL